MIEKMRLEEAKRNVKTYIEDRLLKTGDKDAARFVGFFMANAESSLRTASILQEISDENSLKETLKVSSDFESYLWVIVSSYYSMFYAATAILAKQGVRATGQIVHKVTADALIHFFASNEKLAETTRAVRGSSDSRNGTRRSRRAHEKDAEKGRRIDYFI